MKRTVTAILVLAMIFALFAVTGASAYADIISLTPEEKEAVFWQVVVEKGIMTEVMEALYGIPATSYSPAYNGEAAESAYAVDDFYGIWVEKSSGATLEFYDDPFGRAIKITSGDGMMSSTRFGWVIQGDIIKIEYSDYLKINIVSDGNTVQLKYNGGVYVREDDYNSSIPTLEVGDTAETDMVKFTLNKYQLAHLLGLDYSDWLMPIKGTGGLSAGTDKMFVWCSFSVSNLSKRELSGYDVCDIAVDYNDGYMYDDAVYSSNPLFSTSSGVSQKTGLESIQPLGTTDYIGYVKCTDQIKTNRDAPLRLIVTLPCSTGKTQFAYVLGIDETADTGAEALAVSECIDKAIDDLMFVKKYIGNQTPNGSREVDSRFTDGLLAAFSDVDEAYISSNLPETAAALPTVKENIRLICDMIFEMNKTNSPKDVDKMKALASDTIALLEALVSKEYSAFN